MSAFNRVLSKIKPTFDLIILRIFKEVLFLFGLAPFSVKISESPVERSKFVFKFSQSRNRCAYNIIVGVLFTSYIVWKKNNSNWINTALFAAIHGATATINFIYCYYSQQLIAIGNRLAEYDRAVPMALSRFYHCEDATLQMIIVTTAATIVWLIDSVLVVIKSDYPMDTALLMTVGLSYNCFWIQYIMIIILLKNRLSALNAALMKIGNADAKRKTISVLSFDASCESRTERNIVVIRKARNILYAIAYSVEEFYSLPVVVAVIECCCIVVYSGYYTIGPFILSEPPATPFLFYNYACWGIEYLWILACFSINVNKLIEEVRIFTRETIIVVYDIMETYDDKKSIKSSLIDFSYESLNRQMNFTACKMFPLDCSLLLSILSMMGTYMVIALQYKP
ncbi:uncharacterized protein LOC114841048 [Diachasma alloeum]|uniref:Gustatory receptor n=1 Tax=Diachasma alloeum TaxID=454923 RepID=A0A4E0RJJ8_9HYME|nr:uncharacterized protein LOC114841048 [Diachasma alloeum]THK32922.1 gustatory receptor 38 [Diachasma alloeum]